MSITTTMQRIDNTYCHRIDSEHDTSAPLIHTTDGQTFVNVSAHCPESFGSFHWIRIGSVLSKDTSNVKLAKSAAKFGQTVVSYIVYFAPHSIIGVNVCAKATSGCIGGCLYSSNNGRYISTQLYRIARTLFWRHDRAGFVARVDREFTEAKAKEARKAKRENRKSRTIACRLNGTSDVMCRRYLELIDNHKDVRFYDYTAVIKRARYAADRPNYDVTFSRKETPENHQECDSALERGVNVAAVFSTKLYQQVVADGHYNGTPIVDGDAHDLRLPEMDGRGAIIALKAKGDARTDTSGFVIR